MRTSTSRGGWRFSWFGVRILDRYIFREFVMAFLAVMAFFALLVLVASIFDKFGDIMKNDTPIMMAVLYFAYSMPFLLVQVVPIASMLAVLFSIGSLARNNEILALMTSGVHALRIATPVILGGIVITASAMYLNETIVPDLSQKARLLELQYIEGKDKSKIEQDKNVFARGRDNRFYLMRIYNSNEKCMYYPQIVDRTPDATGVRSMIKATTATLVRDEPEKKRSEWLFHQAMTWTFDEKGNPKSYQAFDHDVAIYLEDNLPTVLSRTKKTQEMNFMELRDQVKIKQERGQPVQLLLTDLVLKLTFPAGTLLIMLIAYSYAVRTRGGAAMAAYGYGMAWTFAYYGCNALVKALGHSGALNAYVAGCLPLAVFALIAVRYLNRSYRWYA